MGCIVMRVYQRTRRTFANLCEVVEPPQGSARRWQLLVCGKCLCFDGRSSNSALEFGCDLWYNHPNRHGQLFSDMERVQRRVTELVCLFLQFCYGQHLSIYHFLKGHFGVELENCFRPEVTAGRDLHWSSTSLNMIIFVGYKDGRLTWWMNGIVCCLVW